MTAPILLLENYRTKERVEIGGNNLPEGPIQWGGKVRREVQRYIGTDRVSAQIMGTIDDPITLSGILDDQYKGNAPGQAQALKQAIEALLYSGDLIRLAYNREQRWGILDVSFSEETDTRIGYELMFEPLFREPPALVKLTLERAPVDTSSDISGLFDELKARAAAQPPSLASEVATFVLNALDIADNALSEINGYLASVVYYGDLTADTASRVNRSLASALKRIGDIQRQLRAAGASSISTVMGSGELLATIWRDDVLESSKLTAEAILGFFISMQTIITPVSSRVHIVRDGESLEQLALEYYGDFTLWTLIADANGLAYDDIEPGDELIIPKRQEV